MRGHKYVKRTGTPGNYQYWYKLPDGRLTTGTSADQRRAKAEHKKRLVAAKLAGHTDMSYRQMQEKFGETSFSGAHTHVTNNDHDFDDHHMKEALHHDVEQAGYRDKIARHHGAEASTTESSSGRADREARETPSRSRRRSSPPRGPDGAPSSDRGTDGLGETPRRRRRSPARDAAASAATSSDGMPRAAETPAPEKTEAEKKEAEKKRLIKLLKENHGIDLSEDSVTSPEAVDESRQRAEAASTPTPARSPSATELTARGVARQERDRRENEEDASRQPGGDVFTSASSEGASLRTAHRETPGSSPITASGHPEGSAARDLSAADPDFAASEESLSRIAASDNPYVERAKEIYNRIKSQIDNPERKQSVENMLKAFKQAGDSSAATIKAKYNEIRATDGGPAFGAAKAHFERGSFVTFKEASENKPLDLEVERAKRGFAAKQFNRLKPFLSDTFASANPSAPPPYPTFSDLKSWSQHGSARPESMSWTTPTGRAGGVTKAMPQEFFDSIAKGPDGKPQMPPAWMPLSLTPAWNYVVKKGGDNPYASGAPSVDSQSSKISVPVQASFREGFLLSALRKYVVMRGGADQLVDIPSAKLAEAGTTHTDIFKADKKELSDAELKKLGCHKIIDPIALAPFLEKEMKSAKKVKKSFSLVVKSDASYIPGETFIPTVIVKSKNPDIKKSRRDTIKRIINERRAIS